MIYVVTLSAAQTVRVAVSAGPDVHDAVSSTAAECASMRET